MTLEAGGVVRIGDRWWNAEDPATLPDEPQPAIVAGSRATAEQILRAIAVAGL